MAYNAPPNQSKKYQQGYYRLINPEKYISNPDQIIYRSSLELKFCKCMDLSPKVLKWGSEVVSIPYMGADRKQHTYHIDFYVEIVDERNPASMERLLIEVKPHTEAVRVLENKLPDKPKKTTPTSLRNWEYAVKEYLKNKHKWFYAKEYARLRNMKFLIVTEKLLQKFFQ
jgi:hypothetical protein